MRWGDERLDRWLSAEAKALMVVVGFLSQLGQDPITRRSHVPISGAQVSGDELVATFNAKGTTEAALAIANGNANAVAALLEVLEGPLAHAQCPTPRQGELSGAREQGARTALNKACT
jgi:hypothetical protein